MAFYSVSKQLAYSVAEAADTHPHTSPLLKNNIALLIDRYPLEEGWLQELLPHDLSQTRCDRIYLALNALDTPTASRTKLVWHRLQQIRSYLSDNKLETLNYPDTLRMALFCELKPDVPSCAFSSHQYGLPRDLFWDSVAKTIAFKPQNFSFEGGGKLVYPGICLDSDPKTAYTRTAILERRPQSTNENLNQDAKLHKMFAERAKEGIWPIGPTYSYDEQFVITMPWADGSLWDLLSDEENAPLTFDEQLSILKQLTVGLDAIHKAGYLHADIKTENILYKRVNGKIIVGFTDFGHSFENKGIAQYRYGYYGSIWCTPPELDGNPEHVVEPVKADMWALGFLFFEVCFGMVPSWFQVTDWYASEDRYLTYKLDEKDFREMQVCHDDEIEQPRTELAKGSIESQKHIVDLLVWDLLSWNPNDRPDTDELLQTLSHL